MKQECEQIYASKGYKDTQVCTNTISHLWAKYNLTKDGTSTRHQRATTHKK